MDELGYLMYCSLLIYSGFTQSPDISVDYDLIIKSLTESVLDFHVSLNRLTIGILQVCQLFLFYR